jgi:hypothetical protein
MEEKEIKIEQDEYAVHTPQSTKIITKNDKKQIKKNLIKFVVWVILLLLSWSYIQKHPAEKVSVFSGFEVLVQKIEIFIQSTFGHNGELLERKYGMEKYYKELIKMAENNKCIDVSTLQEIEDTYKNLKKENLDWLEYFLPEYTKKAYEYDNIVKDDDC